MPPAPAQPMQKQRKTKSAQNAQAEIRHVPRDENARLGVRPVQDAQGGKARVSCGPSCRAFDSSEFADQNRLAVGPKPLQVLEDRYANGFGSAVSDQPNSNA